ncbi:Nuclear pore complex protein Nup85 [Trichinella zimbabwensis]|uniref:Nuclear pore complex protein Nup85 n=1 Tax=Trichinella zimbabwensis TaxID=268475 RepID=A0A0V1HKJ8_9BILA|nr:Nuclear pore complex protein Nup85 [Trichinella zimbabwensis]
MKAKREIDFSLDSMDNVYAVKVNHKRLPRLCRRKCFDDKEFKKIQMLERLSFHTQPMIKNLSNVARHAQSDPVTLQKLRDLCEGYILTLQGCCRQMHRVKDSHVDNVVQTYKRYQSVLCLFSLIYISDSEFVSLSEISNWAKLAILAERKLLQEINIKVFLDSEFSADHWNCIYLNLLLGNIDSALKLMRKHPSVQEECFQIVIQLLQVQKNRLNCTNLPDEMIIATEYGMANKIDWWPALVTQVIRKWNLSIYPELKTTCYILLGRDESLNHVTSSNPWLVRFFGKVFSHSSALSKTELSVINEDCLLYFSALSFPNDVYAQILNYDSVKLLIHVGLTLNDLWLAITFSTFLYCIQARVKTCKDVQLNSIHELRGYFLRSAGICLINSSQLWKLGVEYLLKHANGSFSSLLSSCLESLAFRENENSLTEILEICNSNGLHDIALNIRKLAALKMATEGNYVSALRYSVETKNEELVKSVTMRILKNVNFAELMTNKNLLQEIPIADFAEDHILVVLVKYQRLCHMAQDGHVDDAIKYLTNLTTVGSLPKYVLFDMFRSIRLWLSWTKNKNVLSRIQLIGLLKTFENLLIGLELGCLNKQDLGDVSEDEIKETQLCLMNTLSFCTTST